VHNPPLSKARVAALAVHLEILKLSAAHPRKPAPPTKKHAKNRPARPLSAESRASLTPPIALCSGALRRSLSDRLSISWERTKLA